MSHMSRPADDETLTQAQVTAYLHRLGASAPASASVDALAALHRAHLFTVPFENLDIHLGRPMPLDPDSLFRKVVGERRGGYCYELNGLFAALLRSLGYAVTLVSARVATAEGGLTPEFDHLALVVDSPEMAQAHLADVGFGEAFLDPLPLRDGFERREGLKRVGLAEALGVWTYREDRGEGWRRQYVFSIQPRSRAEFEPRHAWQQTSPESHFRQSTVVSLATPSGRVTVSENRLIVTESGHREECELADGEVPNVLRERFGIVLP